MWTKQLSLPGCIPDSWTLICRIFQRARMAIAKSFRNQSLHIWKVPSLGNVIITLGEVQESMDSNKG